MLNTSHKSTRYYVNTDSAKLCCYF